MNNYQDLYSYIVDNSDSENISVISIEEKMETEIVIHMDGYIIETNIEYQQYVYSVDRFIDLSINE